ncbi:hypothetical protein [Aureivirga sp. CE67]|uniref:hypothetical protein n=1 Tax=Aureivirga sp. CE67 TaxID=1788983 RepID=UPI0018C97538|nr:hypothetical protein [Aureivirga sp. CE67]
MSIWFYVGIGLILWQLYDLYIGVTWTFRPIYRKYEPITYWLVTIIWIIIAIATLISGMY